MSVKTKRKKKTSNSSAENKFTGTLNSDGLMSCLMMHEINFMFNQIKPFCIQDTIGRNKTIGTLEFKIAESIYQDLNSEEYKALASDIIFKNNVLYEYEKSLLTYIDYLTADGLVGEA